LWKLSREDKAPGVSYTSGETNGHFNLLCAIVDGTPTFGGAIASRDRFI